MGTMSKSKPSCWCCDEDLIQGGDHEADDEEHLIVSNFTCPGCNAFYLMYWGEADDEVLATEI